MPDAQLNWSSYAISHTGNSRKCNEDAYLDWPKNYFWLVADGVGGHAAGDYASNLIVDTLKKIPPQKEPSNFVDELEDKLLDINQQLRKKAKNKTTIGSTIVALMASGQHVIYFWVGDSRLYRCRNNILRQMTVDHSQVQQYVDMGLLKPEEALKHPHSNIILRAVGANNNLYLDMDIQKTCKGDRYLLCSDGLTEHVSDLELQRIMCNENNKQPQEISQELIDLTLSRGAKDNVTVVVLNAA